MKGRVEQTALWMVILLPTNHGLLPSWYLDAVCLESTWYVAVCVFIILSCFLFNIMSIIGFLFALVH